jgi:hypothetical protein
VYKDTGKHARGKEAEPIQNDREKQAAAYEDEVRPSLKKAVTEPIAARSKATGDVMVAHKARRLTHPTRKQAEQVEALARMESTSAAAEEEDPEEICAQTNRLYRDGDWDGVGVE